MKSALVALPTTFSTKLLIIVLREEFNWDSMANLAEPVSNGVGSFAASSLPGVLLSRSLNDA